MTVNGQPAGAVTLGMSDSTFAGRNGIQGVWHERIHPFDPALLKAGANSLTVPAGPVGNGVMYDSLRPEMEEESERP